MLRQPAVAHRFYPGSPAALAKTIEELRPAGEITAQKAHAIICPHAGYVYSGRLACRTIASAVLPETIIIIGPNHHGRGAQAAVSTKNWQMIPDVVPVNRELALKLVSGSPHLSENETAHIFEHSLEVQIPLLQAYRENLQIVPIAVSQISYSMCREIGTTLAEAIKDLDERPLILASTDMSHFESRESGSKKDQLALDCVSRLDDEGLYQTVYNNRITMCGVIPVTITLVAAKLLGARKAELVGYTDSGEVTGDTDEVVGYAGFVIS